MRRKKEEFMTLIRKTMVGKLPVEVYASMDDMGLAAAQKAAEIIRESVADRGVANTIFATGNSQLAFFQSLRNIPDVPWQAVNAFHMDDYVHLLHGHPAGFPLTLRRNLFDHVQIGNFFPIPGWATDLETACNGYELLLRAHPADLCCLGIGENGHFLMNQGTLNLMTQK
jgi:glucosamine-6-phosphate deaminase